MLLCKILSQKFQTHCGFRNHVSVFVILTSIVKIIPFSTIVKIVPFLVFVHHEVLKVGIVPNDKFLPIIPMICLGGLFVVKTIPIKIFTKNLNVPKFDEVQNLFLVSVMSKQRLPDPGRISVKLTGNGTD